MKQKLIQLSRRYSAALRRHLKQGPGANLEQAIFHRATLKNAILMGANLTYADFSYANIEGADFSRAKLFRARFHRTQEEGAKFTDRTLALGDDELLAEAEDFHVPR